MAIDEIVSDNKSEASQAHASQQRGYIAAPHYTIGQAAKAHRINPSAATEFGNVAAPIITELMELSEKKRYAQNEPNYHQ